MPSGHSKTVPGSVMRSASSRQPIRIPNENVNIGCTFGTDASSDVYCDGLGLEIKAFQKKELFSAAANSQFACKSRAQTKGNVSVFINNHVAYVITGSQGKIFCVATWSTVGMFTTYK